MASRTEELLDEMRKGETPEEKEQSWKDFVKSHGYAIGQAWDSYVDYMIPNSFYVDEAESFGWYDDSLKEFIKGDPHMAFIADGGKFITDIYGVEPDIYVDTPENRKIIIDYMSEHPEIGNVFWENALISGDNAAYDDYQNRFKDAHDCHFIAELKLDKETYELSGMSGSESETLGYGKDDIIPSIINFPNGISIQFNVLVEEDDCLNSCEALILEDDEFKGDSYDGDSLLGIWELEDNNGNTYHVRVSPPDVVLEHSVTMDKEDKQETSKEYHVDLYASSAQEDKIIEDLIEMTGDETYDKYGMKRDEIITHTAKFDDGIEVDIKLVVAENDSYNWCEAVIFKNGSEIGCSDVSEELFGPWELEDHEGNKYCVDMHPYRDLVRQKEGSVKVSGSVPKPSKKVQPNLGR